MKKARKYKHIFFDLDNTLWDFKRNSFFAMEAAFDSLSISEQNIDFNHFFDTYSKHNHHLWSEYRNNRVTKKDLTKKRFQFTFDELGINEIDPHYMNAVYLEEMPGQTNLIDGTKEILEYLKSKHYNLYIITNGFEEVQMKKLESSGLSSFFEKVYISDVIKSPKPNHKIFEFAIKSSNAKKNESLMIGDDWNVDILGAVGFGIDSVYANPFDSVSESLEIKKIKSNSIYLINDLIQLKDIL